MSRVTQSMLFGFPPDAKQRVGREMVQFRHRLEATGLFTDENLARLLDAHPRSDLTICTMRDNPPPDELWIAGEGEGLSGAQLLEAARSGALWLSLRNVMTRDPDCRAVFDRAMKEFTVATGSRLVSANGSILITSPKMGIFMHVDPVEAMLWHVRGHKTLHLYQRREEYLTEQALESILLKQNLGDLPYDPVMENYVTPYLLQPGDGAWWPLHSPHRVLNGDDLNVSVSVDFASRRSTLVNGLLYTNGILRRRLGMSPVAHNKPPAIQPAYWLAASALKRLMPPKNLEKRHTRLFDVDLAAPRCVRWRDGVGPATERAAV